MSDFYHYPVEHIQQLLSVAKLRRMTAPEGFYALTAEALQRCYNGIGPEQWSCQCRRIITRCLEWLEAPALIHDYEYTLADKNYRKFTAANGRLCLNAWKDGRFRFGIIAALLCQLFGYRAYLHGSPGK